MIHNINFYRNQYQESIELFNKKLQLEIVAIYNLIFRNSNYHQIEGYDIFLGALPNARIQSAKELKKNHDIGAVLSLNEPWERKPLLISIPHTKSQWNELNISYKEIDAIDHVLLSSDQMERSADYIHAQLSQKKKVYVHCRAGAGRSATAIAAYLIKYQNMGACQARDLIKKSRPLSTIHNKMKALEPFETICRERLRSCPKTQLLSILGFF
ncbi:MAG TPA: dual specificity protein phosphatase family protein [Chlamydiales bacterium]|nr:dual specificity protein phosphatase family protein [Chlamydiales bacterium]